MRLPITVLLACTLLTLRAQEFNWQWSRTATSTVGVPDVQGLATDAAGNSYITGSFSGTATFGSLPPITSAGQSDVFVAKYDNAGNALWVVRGGGADSDVALGIAVDGLGHAFITGYFQSASAVFGNSTLARVGLMDIFCVRVESADGAFGWAQRFGSGDFSSEHIERGNAIACDHDGNVYLTGCFRYTLAVDGLPTLDGCSQYYTTFLLKMNGDGNGLWSVRPECGHDWDLGASEGQKLAVNTLGDVYLGLRHRGDTCFVGTDTLVHGFNAAQTHDGVLVKYDADGQYHWARLIEGQGYDDVEALTADNEGRCYVAMHREGTYHLPGQTDDLDFGGNFGYFKNVLLKFNAEGDLIWGDRLGNSSWDHGITGFALDDDGHLFVAGWYDGHFEIGGIEPLPNTFGFSGLYVARFDTADVLQEVFASRHALHRGVRGLGFDLNYNLYIAGYFSDTLAFPGLPTLQVPASAAFVARSGDVSTGTWEQVYDASDATAYPVPTPGPFTVSSRQPFTALRITDVLGQVVEATQFSARNTHTLELTRNGVYTYRLLNNGQPVGQGRVVVQQ